MTMITTLSDPTRIRRQRSVSFDSVHVHQHEVVLGDNPSVSSGLPIALGNRSSSDVMDVDEYEQYERRGRSARLLTKQDRAELIRGTQTIMAIFKAKRELKRIRKSRDESFQKLLEENEKAFATVKVI